jgi:hypothetical protein
VLLVVTIMASDIMLAEPVSAQGVTTRELASKCWRTTDHRAVSARQAGRKFGRVPVSVRTRSNRMLLTLEWRICFKWVDGNAESVEIVDYH